MDTIFKAIVGSHSYGTSTPESDTDYKGVYCQDFDKLIGFGYREQIEVGKDETYYEIRRFIQLLQTANPTVLELLYSPSDCIITMDAKFEILVENRQRFLTKRCLSSFGGYAVQQIQKAKGLDKKMNWEKERVERKTLLDFCYTYQNGKTIPLKEFLKSEKLDSNYCGLVKLDHFRDCYALYYDYQKQYGSESNRVVSAMGYNGLCNKNGTDLILSEAPKYADALTIMYWNKDAYTTHCKDYSAYQVWLKERNKKRFIETKTHGQKIDGKNMMHCRRLLDVAKEIVANKEITVRRPNAEYLLAIRRGDIDLNKIIKDAEYDVSLLNDIYKNSDLPESVDMDFCNELLLKIRK